LHPRALRGFGGETRRAGETRIDIQAAAIKILRRLGIKFERLVPVFRHTDELREARAIRIAVLAKPGHFVPEAVHRRLTGFIAVIGQIAVNVVLLCAPASGFDRSAARKTRDQPSPENAVDHREFT
jgi:hypothetical protein